MDKYSRVYVAGHQGLVGSAILRRLQQVGHDNLVICNRDYLDLTDQRAVLEFFATVRPEYVFLAAARVGGIVANNTFPADFLRDNLQIQTNVIDAAWRHGVRKLLFLGSSCIYPRLAPQPLREEYLLSGPLEPTNEWYAVAKIAGIKMCQAYRRQYGFSAVSLMPTNLYGPGDNFDLETSHVLPAMIRRFHDAKSAGIERVELWGTGTPLREFLHVDDLADASLFLMEVFDEEDIINVGSGDEVSICELAKMVAQVVGYRGELAFDCRHPDGTPRKVLDCSRLVSLGWRPKIHLVEGILNTYQWCLENPGNVRGGAWTC